MITKSAMRKNLLLFTVFVILSCFILNAQAEYYHSGCVACMPVTCIYCEKSKQDKKHYKKHYKKQQVLQQNKISKKHIVAKKPRNSYSISVYYYVPVSPCEPIPACACCPAIIPYTAHDYVTFSTEPTSYRNTSMEDDYDITYDTRTGDDDVMSNSDMNNGY